MALNAGRAMTNEPQQLSLLQGFPASPRTAAGPPLAASLPVARVLIESSLPHLDRPFDYSVPAEMADTAQAGVRVKVKFSGQELSGYILERTAESDAGHELVPLHKVVSPVAVLTPGLKELANRVAARYAGTVSDVLRVAIPPRVAKVEKELAADEPGGQPSPGPETQPAAVRSTQRRPGLGGIPERERLPAPPQRRRIAAGRAQRPAGLRPRRLAAADRRGGRGGPAIRTRRGCCGARLPGP